MSKPLLIIRYAIRLAVFIGLLIPFMCIGVPFFFLLNFLANKEPDYWITKALIDDFIDLAVWGK